MKIYTCSASCVIREMKSKITKRHYLCIKMLTVRNSAAIEWIGQWCRLRGGAACSQNRIVYKADVPV